MLTIFDKFISNKLFKGEGGGVVEEWVSVNRLDKIQRIMKYVRTRIEKKLMMETDVANNFALQKKEEWYNFKRKHKKEMYGI